MDVDDRDLQRRRAFLLRLRIEIGVHIGKRGYRLHRALPRGIHQRGPAAFRQREHGHAVGLVAVFGERQLFAARVQIRFACRQGFDRRAVVLGGSPHQRGLPLPGFARVDVDAAIEQRVDDVGAAGARGRHQDGLAVRTRSVGVRPGLQQRARDGPVAVGRRERQWSNAVAVGGAGVLRLICGHSRSVHPGRSCRRLPSC